MNSKIALIALFFVMSTFGLTNVYAHQHKHHSKRKIATQKVAHHRHHSKRKLSTQKIKRTIQLDKQVTKQMLTQPAVHPIPTPDARPISDTHLVNNTQDQWVNEEVKAISAKATNLDPTVLRLSLNAYQKVRQKGIDKQEVLTVIDYSKPSTEKRLWVIDLKSETVIFNTLVAHGKNTGTLKATDFSNKPQSLKSSFGVFVTDETYSGHKGPSLRIQGLERGINDNVYRRNIVFHGASYVSEKVAKVKGMIGRSWGCMAVNNDIIQPLINKIKNNTVVFAYFPDPHWLRSSQFLS